MKPFSGPHTRVLGRARISACKEADYVESVLHSQLQQLQCDAVFKRSQAMRGGKETDVEKILNAPERSWEGVASPNKRQ